MYSTKSPSSITRSTSSSFAVRSFISSAPHSARSISIRVHNRPNSRDVSSDSESCGLTPRSIGIEYLMEIPGFLSHLPTHHGLPIPFTQMFVNGVPDFRAVDPLKILKCLQETLCAVCGNHLGRFSFFIGG